MSRARKLYEELNETVKEYNRAYLIYKYKNSLIVTHNILTKGLVIMAIHDEISEEAILDRLLMLWEDECDSRSRNMVPNYLWAMRNRLRSDYNVD